MCDCALAANAQRITVLTEPESRESRMGKHYHLLLGQKREANLGHWMHWFPPGVRRVRRTAYAIEVNRPYFASLGALDASFWKRGSFRRGSNIGSSRSRAGVSGTFEASELS